MNTRPLTPDQRARRARWLRLTPGQRAAITAQVEATRADIRVRKWALSTERSYCMWVRRYGVWLASSSEARALPDATARVTGFLRQLVTGPSPRSGTTLSQALNALVYFYRDVRKQPLARLGEIPRPRRAERLPHVLTLEQIRQIIAAIVDSDDYPYRLIARLLYHSGMRIGDVLNLRVQDIDWDRAELVLRAGKGDKDRIVPLPRPLLAELRAYLERVRLLWQRDQLDRVPVQLPDGVYNKCPRYGLAWPWYFVFASPAPPPPRLRHAPPRGRRRHPLRARHPRPCRRRHDHDLHAPLRARRARPRRRRGPRGVVAIRHSAPRLARLGVRR